MRQLLNIVNPLHTQTTRDYIGRMQNNKIDCMRRAREYGYDYWDGHRDHGYGGYVYDGRWSVVAAALIEQYRLPDNARILDVGCGKGYLLYEFTKLLPACTVKGFDLSAYAIENAHPEIQAALKEGRAEEDYPFADDAFDLVLSITTLHNLYLPDLQKALQEIERVGRNKYIVVESYRNPAELFNLQCWALTCEAFFTPGEWLWLLEEFKYTGDYELIYFT
ncbi:MAG: class I SAM-dependent methyltransferase [Desulfobacterales bacterium]|nr:class I SAM-dependent methyltransferase [Desulfobacterales bacterium]